MKTLLLLLLSCLPLAAQPHIVGISPPIGGPSFGTNVFVFGEQLANKSATIEGAPAHNFQNSYTLAFYACYTVRQTVVATAPLNAAFAFFRCRNDPCNGGEALAGRGLIDSELYIPTIDGRMWRLYEIAGSGGTRFVAEEFLQP